MSAYFRKIFAVLFSVLVAIGSLFSGSGNLTKHDLTLEFGSNPSTGCTWVVSVDNEDVVEYSGNKYKADLSCPGVSGRGGTEYFYFDAVADGKATITMTYGHHWENGEVYRTVIVECESADSDIKVLNINDSAATV